jgi:predicted amidohydrolase YtcJ
MKKRYWVLGAAAVIGAAATVFLRPASAPDAYIMSGGTILTMDVETPRVEAIAVSNGVISGRGELQQLQQDHPGMKLIDLAGQTLLPGLIEPHTHPIASALLGAVVDVSGFTYSNRADIMAALGEAGAAMSLTPWLIAYGWDPVAIADLSAPTLQELDAISPDRPMIVLTQMMHEAFVNSAALEAAGISMDGAPEDRHGVLRGADGRPTGVLRELDAINAVLSHVPPAADPVVELLLRRQYAAYAKAGYTTIGITGAVGRHPDPAGLIERVSGRASPLRSFLYLLPEQMDRLPLGGDAEFSVLGAKFWMDGSPFTGGAASSEPYEDTHLTNERLGIPHSHLAGLAMDTGDFEREVSRLHGKGYQIAVHAQGERAVNAALAAFSSAQADTPRPGLHHRIEHNALITPDQIRTAKRLGVSLGFFIDHIYFYGDALPELFGTVRADRYMPMRQAIDEGVVTALHGDHPASPVGPLRSLGTATTRLSRSGLTRTAPDQAISMQDALLAMTLNAARQLRQDKLIGSLEVGKLADFTVMSGDPTRVAPEDIIDLQVTQTWRNGQPVDTGMMSWLKPGLVAAAVWGMIAK